LLGPPEFFKESTYKWGICPKFFEQILMCASSDSSLSFTVSAVELYFNDCLDLLNEKAKIPIEGQSKVKKASFVVSDGDKGGKAYNKA
jgi:hypothetical protein